MSFKEQHARLLFWGKQKIKVEGRWRYGGVFKDVLFHECFEVWMWKCISRLTSVGVQRRIDELLEKSHLEGWRIRQSKNHEKSYARAVRTRFVVCSCLRHSCRVSRLHWFIREWVIGLHSESTLANSLSLAWLTAALVLIMYALISSFEFFHCLFFYALASP